MEAFQKCPNCNALIYYFEKGCTECGYDLEKKVILESNIAKKNAGEKAKSDANKYSHIILTTAPTIAGYKIIETLEIVTAECVFGINIFEDFFMSVRDIFGGRSGIAQEHLRNARKVCLHELRKEANLNSADAVISVRLDYSQISGKGKNMLFLVASGTAVKISKSTEADLLE